MYIANSLELPRITVFSLPFSGHRPHSEDQPCWGNYNGRKLATILMISQLLVIPPDKSVTWTPTGRTESGCLCPESGLQGWASAQTTLVLRASPPHLRLLLPGKPPSPLKAFTPVNSVLRRRLYLAALGLQDRWWTISLSGRKVRPQTSQGTNWLWALVQAASFKASRS